MDARHLALLRDLRDRGSVQAVATASQRTPSAVSQQLRTAQRDLKIKLVEPEGRGLRLTPAGELLAQCAGDVAASLARAQASLDEFLQRPSGAVKIVTLPSAAAALMPGALTMLEDDSIEVIVEDMDVPESDFAHLAHDCDIVIGHSMLGEIPTGAEALRCRTLAREPLDIALPMGHRLASHEWVTPHDLVGESWVCPPDGYPFATLRQAIEQVSGHPARVRQQVRDNRLVESLVSAGIGIAVLPRFSTLSADRLHLRPLRGVAATRWVVGMSLPDRAERVAVRRVLEVLSHVGADLTHASHPET
ncbi:MAG: LysR family transcriptional regulator [Marmoricola sp.]